MPNIDCHIQIEADNITTWQPWCVQDGTDGKDLNVHDLLVLTSLDNQLQIHVSVGPVRVKNTTRCYVEPYGLNYRD